MFIHTYLALWRLRLPASCIVLAVISMTSPAFANTPLDWKGNLNDFLSAGSPVWNFARTNGHDTCWPSDAFVGGEQQHPPADVRDFPNVDFGCPAPETNFPVYASVATCFGTEVRAIYTLYFPKDGFNPSGHPHDFEHAIVIWTYAGNNQWIRSKLMLSTHGGHRTIADWSKVESRDGSGNVSSGLDHPIVFVGWAKHAMFNQAGGLSDVASQTTGNEFRNAAHSVRPQFLLNVAPDNALAHRFDNFSWGSATSNPAQMARDICNL